MSDRRGSAVQWFALAAAVVCVASMVGAHTLDWLSRPGRIALVTDRAPAAAQNRRVASDDPGIDSTPTGSIPASRSLVIRLR